MKYQAKHAPKDLKHEKIPPPKNPLEQASMRRPTQKQEEDLKTKQHNMEYKYYH